MLLVHIGDGRLENFVTSHPLFRLPLFIMGVSAALLTLRGVEYPQVIMIIIIIIINSVIVQNISTAVSLNGDGSVHKAPGHS